MEVALRISGVLLMVGLLIEAVSLRWNTAPSFLFFMFAGGFCFVAGVGLYFFTLIRPANPPKA